MVGVCLSSHIDCFLLFIAFGQRAVIIVLVSPSFKVLFPPPCNGPLQGLHLDSQIEEEERESGSAGLKLEEQLLAHPPAKAWQQVLGKRWAPGSHRTSAAGPAFDWQSAASFVTEVTGPVIC